MESTKDIDIIENIAANFKGEPPDTRGIQYGRDDNGNNYQRSYTNLPGEGFSASEWEPVNL